ncbi:MAG: 30S ribosomal protein S6 [Actinobacteria bacterium 69-20]|nr:30S ribosomal protein S6 [Actinomycetota bacterium]OJV25023.1 MAG: 30S ribosomal protein S6 [Actinobacteria bacterium 69-20]
MSVSTAPRHYELLLILDPTLDERTVVPSIDQFLNVVRQGGGSVENVDVWGKRRLAFEIQKNSEGIYAVINVQCPAEVVAELDRQLNLNESVLRTKITRPNAKSAK